MKRIVALLVVVAAAALLGTGCGGGGDAAAKPLDKADYVAQVRQIGIDLSTSINKLSSARTAKKAAVTLTGVQGDLRAAVKKLDAITPPDDVVKPHQALASAVGEFADELDPIIVKLKAGNATILASVTTLQGLKDIQAAATAISKAGYKIGA